MKKKTEYLLLQLKEDNLRKYGGQSLDMLKSKGLYPEFGRYNIVYSGSYNASGEPEELLEKLFEKFNLNHPADYKGWSMSVSDVIVVNKESETHIYYCDSIGFQELSFEKFFKSKDRE